MDLNTIISKNDLSKSIVRYLKRDDFEISSYDVSRASNTDIIGFLGEHFRIKVQVKLDDKEKTLALFAKSLPVSNPDKKQFIIDHNFFTKEFVMYSKIFPNFTGDDDPSPWRPKILHVSETIVIMFDLTSRKFTSIDKRTCMNLDHSVAAVTSVAKLHASVLIYEHRKAKELGVPYEVVSEYEILGKQTNFSDCSWFRTGIQAALDFLDAFSNTYNSKAAIWSKIKTNLPPLYLEACNRLDRSEQFRNVILHADLWSNNMMFRYDIMDKPTSVALVDFQCVRYGAYGTDISSFLYLNTDRKLRNEYETYLLKQYHKVLNDELALECKCLLEPWTNLEKNFEFCRVFGLVHATMIFPYILFKGLEAQIFDDPKTFAYLNDVSRSDIILSTAKKDTIYRNRLLETLEEFVERYITL